jgi:leader peptidase (prepilin peptidase)/N-methyltransferase
MKGRSKCLSCGEALRPYDLIPVVSYFLLKGRCRYCKTTYGISSLVIEALFGITFLLLYLCILVGKESLLLSFAWLVYYSLLFIVLGVMALYDKAHSYIPTSFLVAFLALVGGKFVLNLADQMSVSTLISPLAVAGPFLAIWLFTKGKGLGFGDVILFFGVGAFFGIAQGFAVLVISVWMGAIFGLYYKYVVKKKHSMATPIPFVPFIVLSFLLVLFTGIDIVSIAMFFS